MDDVPDDQRLPHDSGRAASDDALKPIGVPIDETGTYKDEVLRIARERDYKNHDVIAINNHEHMHEDEEIRYILAEGTGYFDVRHATESWIRCHMGVGDLLVPAGIYHCLNFMTNHSRIMRLFKDEPKWVAHNRGHETDINPIRIQYLKNIEVQ